MASCLVEGRRDPNDEFFDAVSVASEDPETPRGVVPARSAPPQFQGAAEGRPAGVAAAASGSGVATAASASPPHVTDVLLQRLLETEQQCKNMEPGIEVLVETKYQRYTIKSTPGSAEFLTCLEAFMPGVSKETVINCLLDVDLRKQWDGSSFRVYEKLPTPTKDPLYAEEVLYLVLACPRVLGDRDMLQKCWQRSLPGGGWTMIFQAFEDDVRPITKQNIRARTFLSGYFVRDIVRDGRQGIELISMNSLAFGGNMPVWLQNTVRKMLKNRPIQWAAACEKCCLENPVAPGSDLAEKIQAVWAEPWPGGASTCSGQRSGSAQSSEVSHQDIPLTADEAPVDTATDHPMDALLAELHKIRRRCLGEEDAGEATIECLSQSDKESFWALSTPSSPDVITCLQSKLTGITKEDVIQAITDPAERAKWDSTITGFERLRYSSPEDPFSEEVIYFVLPCPPMVANREMLQRCWRRCHQDGSWALVFQSIDDETIRPQRPELVRARAHIAGYMVRPVDGPGGPTLEMVVINSVDSGGNAPAWMRNKLAKMFKNKPIQWVRALEMHCRSMRRMQSGLEQARRRASDVAGSFSSLGFDGDEVRRSASDFHSFNGRSMAEASDQVGAIETDSTDYQAPSRTSSQATIQILRGTFESDPPGRPALELPRIQSASVPSPTVGSSTHAAPGRSPNSGEVGQTDYGSSGEDYGSVKDDSAGHATDELLAELEAIAARCRGRRNVTSRRGSSFTLECLSSGEKERFFALNSPGTKGVITCAESRFSGVSVGDVLRAVTTPEIRSTWDTTLSDYKSLVPPDPEDALREEVIYFQLPCPRPLANREVLQRCWLRNLDDGGAALIYQSIEDERLAPRTEERVRASARLAGYLLRPAGEGGGDVDVAVINNIDFGGSIPSWLSSRVQKMLKGKPIEWLRCLEKYCKDHRSR